MRSSPSYSRPHRKSCRIAVRSSIVSAPCIIFNQVGTPTLSFPCIQNLILGEMSPMRHHPVLLPCRGGRKATDVPPRPCEPTQHTSSDLLARHFARTAPYD